MLSAPYRPLILVNPESVEALEMSRELSVETTIGIRLTLSGQADFKGVFPALRSQARTFVLQWEEPVFDDGLFALLLHALFATNYLYIENKPVVLFSPGVAGKIQSQIAEKLSEQGYQKIDQPDAVRITEDTPGDQTWISENLLSGISRLNNYVIYDFADPSRALASNDKMHTVCNDYLQLNPILATAFREYKAMHEKYGKLMAGADQMQQQLAASEKTVAVIRTKYKDDYENLFKWYHNEYEILPMWYKRFGHILKVLMGKRTFRSLFSDDVKKYKT